MKYVLHKNLSDRKGTISNLHGFFNRYLDTGFKTKWSGYWSPSYKFLDYYGLKVNGIWLNEDTLQAIEYGNSLIYYHETDSLEIKEEVKIPESLPGFRLEITLSNKTDEKKAVQTILEPGIDIRSRKDDIGLNSYHLKENKNRLTISNGDKNLKISSNDSFKTTGDSYTKTHYPGDEKQICFVPNKPVFRKEVDPKSSRTIEIEFTTSEASFRQLDSVDQKLEKKFGRTFNSSISSMENLIYHRNNTGIIAGHPWFQNYWARDSFWTLLGLIDAGYFEISERILENFAENGLPGKINLDKSKEDMPRSDTEPLYIIASDKLERHHKLSDKLQEGQKQAMKALELDGNVVKHDPEGTWMDTLERAPAVDIQSLWLEAAEIMNDNRAGKLRKGLEEFEQDNILQDQSSGGPETINPAVPLMFGHVKSSTANNQLELINGEFSSRYGARTRSVTDPGYSAGGYHSGSCWGLTTCWAAAANLRYGNDRQGINFLEKMEQFLDQNQPGALPEVVDAESGELLGCSEQAWSAGLFVHVVDSHLLGITVEDGSVSIDPSSGFKMVRKGKRIKGEKLDLEVDDGEVTVLNDPDLNLRL